VENADSDCTYADITNKKRSLRYTICETIFGKHRKFYSIFAEDAVIFRFIFNIFSVLSKVHWQLLHPSRTMGVTMLTFVFVGILLLMVYGDYNIGKRKSKPIIYSITLATIITDIVTWVMLGIMNYNENNNDRFMLENPDIMFWVVVMQLLVIVIFVYFGNFIYFKIYDPERCCFITSCRDNAGMLFHAIEKFKKQYHIIFVDEYTDGRLYKHIDRVDTVFLHEVPVAERVEIMEYCYKNFKKNGFFMPFYTKNPCNFCLNCLIHFRNSNGYPLYFVGNSNI